MAGDALPSPVKVHPGVGESSTALPGLAFIHSFLIESASHDRGVAIGMDPQADGLQDLRTLRLAGHGGKGLGLIVENAFGDSHDEIVGE